MCAELRLFRCIGQGGLGLMGISLMIVVLVVVVATRWHVIVKHLIV